MDKSGFSLGAQLFLDSDVDAFFDVPRFTT